MDEAQNLAKVSSSSASLQDYYFLQLVISFLIDNKLHLVSYLKNKCYLENKCYKDMCSINHSYYYSIASVFLTCHLYLCNFSCITKQNTCYNPC